MRRRPKHRDEGAGQNIRDEFIHLHQMKEIIPCRDQILSGKVFLISSFPHQIIFKTLIRILHRSI